MQWREEQPVELRREVHFDNRVVWCFASRPGSVHRMFADAAAAHPLQAALIGEEGSVTYAELEDRTARISAGLTAAGIERGERVALLMGNHFAFVEVYLACACAGLVCVPMNPRQRAQEIAYAVGQCGASAIVFEADLAGNIPLPQDIPSVRNIWVAYGAVHGFGDGPDVLRDGVVDGARLLPAGWTQAAAQPNESRNDSRYGYQFWLNKGRADRTESARWWDGLRNSEPGSGMLTNGWRSR